MKSKTILCVILALFLLAGCTPSAVKKPDTAIFYYTYRELNLEEHSTVLASEKRDTQGDLEELLTLYLQGPESEDLVSPFPARTELVRVTPQEEYLEIILSNHLSTLSSMELTLAYSAMAKTCFAFTDLDEIRISAESTPLDGAKYISITRDSLLLHDDSAGE